VAQGVWGQDGVCHRLLINPDAVVVQGGVCLITKNPIFSPKTKVGSSLVGVVKIFVHLAYVSLEPVRPATTTSLERHNFISVPSSSSN